MDRARRIALLGLDVDGVMTDGKLYFLANGVEAKAFNIRDGLGLKMIMRGGVITAIITGRKSASVESRAAELGITHIYQGVDDKVAVIDALLSKISIEWGQFAFVGDDLPDLPILRRCGLGVTVPDAPRLLREHAHYITQQKGGEGAVREACELILEAKGSLQPEFERYLV
jgi:3-deoxy-D-manno-octulosonate 8-phosphate phosphatase (KDO 8-P phosphatase)